MTTSFGHFSESEIKKIAAILEEHNIPFEVEVDENIGEEIGASMKNNLRYLHGATVCNDMLVIKTSKKSLLALPEETQKKLNELRIFWEEPDFEDFQTTTEERPAPQRFINVQEPKRNGVVGFVFLFSVLLSLGVLALNYFKE